MQILALYKVIVSYVHTLVQLMQLFETYTEFTIPLYANIFNRHISLKNFITINIVKLYATKKQTNKQYKSCSEDKWQYKLPESVQTGKLN